MFELKFDTNNDDFNSEENDPEVMIARILRKIALYLENTPVSPNMNAAIYDNNGNRIGHWEWASEEEE